MIAVAGTLEPRPARGSPAIRSALPGLRDAAIGSIAVLGPL